MLYIRYSEMYILPYHSELPVILKLQRRLSANADQHQDLAVPPMLKLAWDFRPHLYMPNSIRNFPLQVQICCQHPNDVSQ